MSVDSSPPENELFDPFFDDIQIQKCLDLMKSYSAYVFGNRVLQSLDETLTLEIRHITFFMQSCALKENGIDSWHAFLVYQGYSVDVKDGGTNLLQLKCILYKNHEKQTEVSLMVVEGEPLRGLLMHGWSSAVFQFATYDGIYCLFPEATLEKREMHMFDGRRYGNANSYRWWIERFVRVSPKERFQHEEFEGDRFIGDEWTHRVPFSRASKEVPEEMKQIRFSLSDKATQVWD